MCIVDVDRFKPVNDRYGHISGDEVLRQIAGLIHQHVRHDDIAARIGGEEFAVLLPECATDAAYGFAERLRAAVAAETFTPGGDSHRITISIGIAALSSAHDCRAGMTATAAAPLYRAHADGRHRLCDETCPGSSPPVHNTRASRPP